MYISKFVLQVTIIAIMFSLVSCGDARNVLDSEQHEDQVDSYIIDLETVSSENIEHHVISVESYPLFSKVILERGYEVYPRESCRFRVLDTERGILTKVTMVPCLIPESDESVAFIYYIESDGQFIVTSAEYLKEEGYDIPHTLDADVYERMIESGAKQICNMELVDWNETTKTYWKCVAKRFSAGCLGCAASCFLSGPGWGACTGSCCAGAAIVAVVSCAFTVFGW